MAPGPGKRRIVACAREWIAEHGEAPSVRELGAAVGLTGTSSVAYHLRRLRDQTRGRPSGRCPHCGQ
ncbi:LexA family transcriptional regulator [Streptomyces antnestii]|uniref:LexA family protein n=1 Tax=Streptomyces antnestii TaxID=2494256 RepID=UPI001CB998A8|nr:LexA family transcriptional regulator [Streptomyces sp. San01]